jgi:hypothetical protein
VNKLSVLTLKKDPRVSEKDLYCPDEFLKYGWVQYLPFQTHLALWSIAINTFNGMNKKDCINNIKERFKFLQDRNEIIFWDFNNSNLPEFDHPDDKFVYFDARRLEQKRRKNLKQAGYKPPQNVDDLINLLIKLEMVNEIKKAGETFLDVIYDPFPHPSRFFK